MMVQELIVAARIIKSLKVNIQCKEDKSKRLSSEIERLGAEKLRIMVYIKCPGAT